MKNELADIYDWCFVSGKVTVLESRMLDYEDFDKLLAINRIDELFKYIVNSKLKRYFPYENSIHTFEKSIDSYLLDHIEEIRLLCPTQIVCDIFLLRYKILDIKNILKSKFAGISKEPVTFYLLKNSDVEHFLGNKEDAAKSRFNEQIDINPPIDTDSSNMETSHKDLLHLDLLPHWSKALLYGINNFKKAAIEDKDSENNRPLIIDLIMDNAYLFYLKRISEQISSLHIKNYLEKLIFINVIESLLRALIYRTNINLLKKYFLNGLMDSADFVNLLDIPVNDWKWLLRKELPVEIVNSLFSGKNDEICVGNQNLIRFEHALDDHLLDIIRPGKQMTFGPDRVFGYLCGLLTEAYNLNLVIGGKVNKIEKALLMDRLRSCYV